tara:strand:+ start:52 stop:396 length:345 start_codon:yes stop_codon:yes gene_type:complete
MATITLTFDNPIQDSVQIGDIIYYCVTSSVGGFSTSTSPIEMGSCTALTEFTLTCNIPNTTPRPSSGDFIMFSKDNRVNNSTLLGYYSEVELCNNSTSHAEVYHISSEVFESSK